MGSHLILRLSANKTIEVHLASTKFVKTYDLVFNKGDVVTVVGTKVQFEGMETISAREVTRGSETFVFRDLKPHRRSGHEDDARGGPGVLAAPSLRS
jgi:hypothetical protein